MRRGEADRLRATRSGGPTRGNPCPARPFPGPAPGLRVLCRGAVAEDGWPPVDGGIPAMPDLDFAGFRRCRAWATGVALLAVTMAATVAAAQAVAQPPALTGSATYRERIAQIGRAHV